jgi:hypothetical protein
MALCVLSSLLLDRDRDRKREGREGEGGSQYVCKKLSKKSAHAHARHQISNLCERESRVSVCLAGKKENVKTLT